MDKKGLTVLAIDASGRTCSAALTEGMTLAGEQVLSGARNHTELLLLMVDELAGRTGIKLSDIDMLAVTKGPGSFTGIRTGISTAQGLAFSLGKDLIGISTLEVVALQAHIVSGFVCPMIDARKKQVYTCLYNVSDAGLMEKVLEDTVISVELWLQDLPESVTFIGDGASAYQDKISVIKDMNYRIIPENRGIIRAENVAFAALRSYQSNPRNELENIVPVYIRPPDAVVGGKRKKIKK